MVAVAAVPSLFCSIQLHAGCKHGLTGYLIN